MIVRVDGIIFSSVVLLIVFLVNIPETYLSIRPYLFHGVRYYECFVVSPTLVCRGLCGFIPLESRLPDFVYGRASCCSLV